MRLSRFDTQFAGLSKYDLGHANSFNLKDFSLSLSFLISIISFSLLRVWKKSILPLPLIKRLGRPLDLVHMRLNALP